MNRSTISPTRSGRMGASLRHPNDPGHYRPMRTVAQSLERAAQRLGLGLSTVQQLAKPADPAYVFRRAAVIADELWTAGHHALAESHCLPLDLARTSVYPVDPCPVFLLTVQEADSADDVSRMAYLVEPSPGALDTHYKRVVKAIALLRQEAAALKARKEAL